MSSKAKVYLVAAAVIVAATVPAGLLSLSAGASTTACGSSCTSPSVESLGTGEVLTVSGSSVVMSAASTSNSGQDWTVEGEGTVQAAVNAGVASSRLLLMYQSSALVEFQYAPDGVPSDKCIGDNYASVNTANEEDTYYAPTLTVTLVPCGVTAASLWAIDQNGALNADDDLINVGYEGAYSYTYLESPSSPNEGYNSPFAEPAVLTVSSSGTVALAPLSEIGGVISPAQAWTAYTSPSQSALRTEIRKSAQVSNPSR
jgi:hypothetical protein